jgi:ferredoxin-NAD(P)+ reductase (naphthalene dioxygenase ferredoxin-specific)
MHLLVQPLGRTFTFAPGVNLLEALRLNDVPVSYSCMAGRCGTCRCKVLDGHVLETGRDAKITDPNGEDHVLACMSVLTENCTIEIPEPDEVITHPARIIKTSVVAIEEMTHDIRRLRLRGSKPLAFSPGQYALLQFTPEHIRPFSIASLPADEEMEFHVRLVPDGRVTGYIADKLQVGDTVRVTGPLGTAYLRTKHEGPMLCVAGGTGLAPVLSIVRGALERGMSNPIHVDELARRHHNLHVHIVAATGDGDPRLRSGVVTDAVAQDFDSLAGWRAYLCGAPPMVDAATFLVRQKGIRASHIHADAFYASSI